MYTVLNGGYGCWVQMALGELPSRGLVSDMVGVLGLYTWLGCSVSPHKICRAARKFVIVEAIVHYGR